MTRTRASPSPRSYNSPGNLGDNYFEKEVDRSINRFQKMNMAESAPQSKPAFATVQSHAQIQSDPIYGSLGPKKPKREDYTPEQQFEFDQRAKTPPTYTDDYDQVTVTANSIKVAEGIVGAKMAEPCDPKQKAKVAETPYYEMATAEDEDPDTVETRKSIKTAEKALKQRFFINAKDKREFEAGAINGTVSKKVLDFAESEDEDIMPVNATEVAIKENAEKAAALKKQENMIKLENATTTIEKTVIKKEIAEEETIEEAKKPGPEDKITETPKVNATVSAEVAKEKGLAPFIPAELMGDVSASAVVSEEGADFIPAELAGEMGLGAIVASQKKAVAIAQAKKKNDLIRSAASLKNRSLEDINI